MALVLVHCIHFLTIVPMQEGIATEHGCEELSHTLERFLSRSAVDSQYRCRSLCCGGQEASWMLESHSLAQLAHIRKLTPPTEFHHEMLQVLQTLEALAQLAQTQNAWSCSAPS